jgi:hypothetical protein
MALQPAAGEGKAVEQTESDQQAREIGNVVHLEVSGGELTDDNRGRCKGDRSNGFVPRKGRVKILGVAYKDEAPPTRHCEERSDEAIQGRLPDTDR